MLNLIAIFIYVIALLAAAVNDLARFEIPDALSIALVAAFALAMPALTLPASILHLTAGLSVFAVAALLFFLGVCGGGDVKLLAATALWFGWDGLLTFLLLTALCGAALALLLLLMRHLVAGRTTPGRWYSRLLSANEGVPYGVAIALSGLAPLLWPAPGAAVAALT